MFEVVISKAARRCLTRLPAKTAQIIRGKIEAVAADPLAAAQQCDAIAWDRGISTAGGRLASVVPPGYPCPNPEDYQYLARWRRVLVTRPQTITLAGEAYVVVPLSEYEALRHAVDEDALDAAAMRRVLEDPNEESVPIELVDRLLAGEESGARLA